MIYIPDWAPRSFFFLIFFLDVNIRITATVLKKLENCAEERLSIIYEDKYWSQCGSSIFPSSPTLPEVVEAGTTLELHFPPNLSSWKFEVC